MAIPIFYFQRIFLSSKKLTTLEKDGRRFEVQEKNRHVSHFVVSIGGGGNSLILQFVYLIKQYIQPLFKMTVAIEKST